MTADSSGNLWVVDSGSNRVLEYVPPFSDGMAATLAIGQANFTSGSANQGGAPTNASLLIQVFRLRLFGEYLDIRLRQQPRAGV